MWTVFGWTFRLLPVALGVLILSNCTMLGLNYASLRTDAKPQPEPEIQAADLADWEAGRADLMAAFETHVYGPWPEGTPVSLISQRVADEDYLGMATLEEYEIAVGNSRFVMGVAVPHAEEEPLPLVIGQSFGSNCSVFASLALSRAPGVPCTSTDVPGLVKYIFGEHIVQPPMEDVFEAGFAYASFQASDLVPDSTAGAAQAMAGFNTNGGPDPSGTIIAWAYGWKAAIDVLEVDARFDASRIAALGHSRHGKSALVAGVWDRRIAAVIAHQSGYGGAALNRSTAGEGVKQITQGAQVMPFVRIPGYPHWFNPAYGDYAGRLDEFPVDQHQLLALLAPTPVFLGNGRRDVWSDPNSTFRAAEAASPVYELHGASGLKAGGMRDYRPNDSIAYFLRAGGHGTDARDMRAILAFLDAHLGARSPPLAPATQLTDAPSSGVAGTD